MAGFEVITYGRFWVTAEEIAYPTLQNSIIYLHTGVYPNGSSWLEWILRYNQQIVSEDGSYQVAVPQ